MENNVIKIKEDKNARWIPYGNGEHFMYCSVCREEQYGNYFTDIKMFCPNCGERIKENKWGTIDLALD